MALLAGRPGLDFVPAGLVEGLDLASALLLHVEGGTVLSRADAGRPLVLVDASWRWAERVTKKMDCEKRRLPPFETAYPRSSKLFRDPPGGLASAEALFAASLVFGVRDEKLLDGFRWKKEFLERNGALIEALLSDFKRGEP